MSNKVISIKIHRMLAILRTQAVRLLLLLGIGSVTTPFAHASANTALSSLETPLQALQSSLSGPVALAIGVIAIAITGAVLIFGGEISDFGKRMAYVVLVLAILLTANSLVTQLFVNATAVIF